MSDLQSHPAEAIIDGLAEHARAMEKLIQRGSGEFHLRTLLKVYDWALEQQPFKAGDRVKLSHDIDLKNSPGYLGYAQYFVKDSKAVVVEVSFNGAWSIWQAVLKFDAEDAKHQFTLGQHHLVLDDEPRVQVESCCKWIEGS